jgi:large subunit GTPase 1
LVGYPNVGKSSTINTLLQTKKVPVSATPGRTKHFQTLFLDSSFMLCDCPGLVMPSFVSTKADMVVNGILPIDQMRDFVPPVSLVCRTICRDVLEATYGVMLPQPSEDEDINRPPTPYELLGAYASVRGYMTHKGIPDYQRAARYILKDYVNGKLLHCVAPPGVDNSVFERKQVCVKSKKSRTESEDAKTDAVRSSVSSSLSSGSVTKSSVDAAFFSQMEPRIRSQGTHGVVGFTRVKGYAGQHHSLETGAPNQLEASSASTKPWKRHNNTKKREKLRRVTAHLDA